MTWDKPYKQCSIPIRPFYLNMSPKNQGLIKMLFPQKYLNKILLGHYVPCIYQVHALFHVICFTVFFKEENKMAYFPRR